jgi:hypothetical protein
MDALEAFVQSDLENHGALSRAVAAMAKTSGTGAQASQQATQHGAGTH